MYQLFYENEMNGMPPMRPLWMEFPTDARSLPIDTEYMLGPDILVAPVLEKEAKSIDVYLPTDGSTSWLDVFSHRVFLGGKDYQFQVDISSLPIFQRSGSIVPKR